MLVEEREGSVEPDYFQFYLRTGSGEHASDLVTEDGFEAHLEAASRGFVYVGTLKKFFPTPVRVEVHDAEPEAPSSDWQHVAEVSIVGDGVLDVLSWSDETALSVPTPTGPLRVRAMWAGLEEGLFEGLPEGRPSSERLVFQVWPAASAGSNVLRWWPEWHLRAASPKAPDGRPQIEGTDEVLRRILAGLRIVPVEFDRGSSPPLPGGQSGYIYTIFGDPEDGAWWVDGHDVRRTMRPATLEEVRELVRLARPGNLMLQTLPQRPPDARWTAMLNSIGVTEP